MRMTTQPNHTPVYGRPVSVGFDTRHVTHDQALRAAGIPLVRDPRAHLPRHAVQAYAHMPIEILEAQARGLGDLTPQQRHVANPNQDPAIQASRATQFAVRTKLAAARHHPDTPTDGYGHTGRVARALEEAGLHLHHTHTQTPNGTGLAQARTLLAMAAGAHNKGARQAAMEGYAHDPEQGSVARAASAQNRNPLVVVADLVHHHVLDPRDPRARISAPEVAAVSPQEALNRLQPAQAETATTAATNERIVTLGPLLAHKAEGKAMALFADRSGTIDQIEARSQQGHQLLVGAYAVTNHTTVLRDAHTTTHTHQPARRHQPAQEER